MQKHERKTVGVLTGWQVYEGTLDTFFSPLLSGIRLAAQDRACNLLIACGVAQTFGETIIAPIRPAWPIPSPSTDFLPVGPWNTDGLIIVLPLLSPARVQDVQRMMANDRPVVFVGAGEGGPAVEPDNAGGIRQAVAHLKEHGHRRIAYIAGSEGARDDSSHRLCAYRSAIREQGLEEDPDLVVYGFHTTGGGGRAIRQLLERNRPFTAVLASNDDSARGAMEALNKAGLRVPDDVAVIGFDDRLETMTTSPPMTSVRYPIFAMGYQALELLLDHFAWGGAATHVIKVPTPLVIRQSCGCQPGAVADASGGLIEQAAPNQEELAVEQRLALVMAQVALAGTRHLGPNVLQAMCRDVVDAFKSSLQQNDSQFFDRTLAETLHRVETAGDEVHAWQEAISSLKNGLPALLGSDAPIETFTRAEETLERARVAVNVHAWQQVARQQTRQNVIENQTGWLAAHLLEALDEKQIAQVLADHLPAIGIRRADVILFAPEGSDPVAWCTRYAVPNPQETTPRFPTRQFPPPWLYPPDEPFSLALLPLVVRGEQAGFIAFDTVNLWPCANISRQLAAAFRSARLYQEAVEGRQLAEEANHLKSRFLSLVSHELRTPLNMVMGLSEMLLEELTSGVALSESHRQDLGRIHTSAQHLDSLIRDVLDLARSEAGRLQLACESLDLTEVLSTVAAMGEQLARNKGLNWQVEIPKRLPLVWGDRTRLRQVALNLVTNAIKFTAQGEVALSAKVVDCKSQIADCNSPSAICITIRDTGLGVPLEEQAIIFDEFKQSERTAARGYGGMGLGLAICRRLVEMHGGSIGMYSSGEEGAGSTFFFSLPTQETNRTASPATQTHTILLSEQIVGGERLLDRLVREGFQIKGMWLDSTGDWLTQLLAAPPEAIILSLEPGSTRGWEILQTLKGHPVTRGIPLLFYSLARETDSGAMLDLDYLTKPVGTMELARALAQQGLDSCKGEGKTILVVDDEPGALDMHARIAEAQLPSGRVLRACNGREALQIIRQEQPNLVLLDLMMPELDGFGVLAIMQSEEATRGIPVIVLTGQSLTEEDMARLNQGVAAVLSKGLFSVEETLSHIKAALERRQRLAGETQWVVRRAVAYVHEHYTEPISRDDIANHIGVSGGHLARSFRIEMGVSLSDYIIRYRINQARLLLAAGEKSITDVAIAAGFSDAAYFSRLFRREVGVSPAAYRRGERPAPKESGESV